MDPATVALIVFGGVPVAVIVLAVILAVREKFPELDFRFGFGLRDGRGDGGDPPVQS